MCGAQTWFCFTLCIGRSAQADRRPKAGGALAWLEERKRSAQADRRPKAGGALAWLEERKRSAQADRRPKAGGALAWLEERKRACMDGSGGCVQGEKHADGSEDTQEYE